MATKPSTMVRGRRYRVTRLDSCGNPVYGDNGQVVTSGVITAALTRNTTETDEIRVTNSAGETCLYEPSLVSLESYTLEIQFCAFDPDMFNIMAGLPVYTDNDGNVVGAFVDTGVSLEDFSFALEIWTGLKSDDACGEIGDTEYGYIVFPYLKGGTLSDFTVENGALNFTIADATTRKGGGWGKGPYPVVVNPGPVAGPLLEAFNSTSLMLPIRTKVAPPEAFDGGRPLLNPAWVVLTDVDATPDDLEVDFDITPSIGVGQGAYYDFGDGTYDYVTTGGGDTTHIYEEAGDYNVRVSANGVDWVEVDVTVTEGS